jgi:hypothetical protein
VFNYAGRDGELTKLTFKPNPNFQPPSLEARVFHDMEGEIRIDITQERLAGIAGQLTQDVKFEVVCWDTWTKGESLRLGKSKLPRVSGR